MGRTGISIIQTILSRRRELALLWFLMSGLWACTQKSAPPQMPPPEVSVVKVAATPVTLFEEYVAQTEAVDTVEIRARVGGILERQAFVDGASVKKGDLLFVIDQQPYITGLAQAKAAVAQAQASYVNSKQNLARVRPLLADQAVSQQDVDAAVAKEAADGATMEAAKAQVKQAELNLDYTTIRAPRDGVISKALIKPGGWSMPRRRCSRRSTPWTRSTSTSPSASRSCSSCRSNSGSTRPTRMTRPRRSN